MIYWETIRLIVIRTNVTVSPTPVSKQLTRICFEYHPAQVKHLHFKLNQLRFIHKRIFRPLWLQNYTNLTVHTIVYISSNNSSRILLPFQQRIFKRTSRNKKNQNCRMHVRCYHWNKSLAKCELNAGIVTQNDILQCNQSFVHSNTFRMLIINWTFWVI